MRLRLFVGLAVALSTSLAWAQNNYKLIKEIPIAGDEGWDYLSIDAEARRLYVTHGNKIVVVDLDKNAVVGEIADTPGVHGLAIVPRLGRGFSSNGAEGQVSQVDLKTLKTTGKIETGKNPDAILYEPRRGEGYAFNGRGNSVTVFDAQTAKQTIPLGGKPEFAVSDPDAGRIYCNVEDTNEVVAIDTAKHEVVARWPTAPGAEPTGLAIDLANHRLFVGCRGLLVMMDSATGKVTATVPIGLGVDACAFDDRSKLVFASCGSGTVTIANIDKLAVVQTLETKPGARTMALDPKTHRIYLATADFKDEPVSPGTRPARKPGTFRVLVYGPE
jgi:DNA-binding beta-propeller fold protein YncE